MASRHTLGALALVLLSGMASAAPASYNASTSTGPPYSNRTTTPAAWSNTTTTTSSSLVTVNSSSSSSSSSANTTTTPRATLPLKPIPRSRLATDDPPDFKPQRAVNLAWQTPDNASLVSVDVTMLHAGAVVLEDMAVTAVDCDARAGTVAVTFNDTAAFAAALAAWSAADDADAAADGRFVIVTNHMGDCDAELERAFFIADADSLAAHARNLTIVAQAQRSNLSSTANSTEINFNRAASSLAARGITWDKAGLSIAYDYALPAHQTVIDTDYVAVKLNAVQINNSVTYSGAVKWELLKGVTRFELDVAKTLHHYADVELDIKAKWSSSSLLSWSPAALSYALVDIPGIISLGPSAGITFGLGLEAGAAGALAAQLTSRMANGSVHVDFVDWGASYADGWTTAHDAVVNVSEAVELTARPYIDFKVEFACELFGGLLDLSTGVKAEPSFPLTTTATATQTINGSSGAVTYPNTTASTSCANGLHEDVDFKFDVVAFATKWIDVTLYEYKADIWDGCLNWFRK